jgi:hypothetical protein
MAEEQLSGLYRPPSRNDLQRFLPDHESIVFIEKLFRSAGFALPADIARLFELIEQFGDTVVKITDDYFVPVEGNFSIMANAAAKPIEVTLPLASLSDAFIVGVTKIDSSSNIVRILPTGSDTIADEAFQDLLVDNEVLNFISDGTNWQLAN